MRTVEEFNADPPDEELRAGVVRLVDADGPPPGLVERVRFAIALEDLDVEVAHWARTPQLAGVRGDEPSTITFYVDDLTVMVNLTRTGQSFRIDGWLVPAGEHSVEVRVADQGSTATTADETGRFVLTGVPRGSAQILIRLAHAVARTVVTPAVVL